MESEPVEAIESLKLLQRTRRATEIAGEVPPSPLWYSAALATTIGGLALFDGGAGGWGWLVLALGAVVAVSVHYFPTVRVLPRRSRRSVITNLAILAVCWALIATWGTFISSTDGQESRSSWWLMVIGLWVATSAVLAVAMTIMNRWRRRMLLESGTETGPGIGTAPETDR